MPRSAPTSAALPLASSLETLAQLRPDPRNANTGTALGATMLRKSIQTLGIGRGIVAAADGTIIGGNHVVSTLAELGYSDIVVVPTTGKTLVVTRRTDIEPGSRAFHELALADNRVAQLNLNFDVDIVADLALDFALDLDDWALADLDGPAKHLSGLEQMPIDALLPHPDNYKQHPDDQTLHLMQSIRDFGLFRSVVISADNYLLVGHGVTEALRRLGMQYVPVVRLTIDHDAPLALKLLVADNEIDHLGIIDDRKLSLILKNVLDADTLNGTGYDQAMLANLVMVSRSGHEIKDVNHAREWVGLPEFTAVAEPAYRLIIHFETADERDRFDREYRLPILKRETKTWSTTYPFRERDDLKNIRFERADLATEATHLNSLATPVPLAA